MFVSALLPANRFVRGELVTSDIIDGAYGPKGYTHSAIDFSLIETTHTIMCIRESMCIGLVKQLERLVCLVG